MPSYRSASPEQSFSLALQSPHESPLPTYTAQDALAGLVTTSCPLCEVRVGLRLTYRCVQGAPFFGWDRHLPPDCDYVDSWSLHVAAYKPTSAVQTLSFGPFDLGLARHWTLLGSTQPGRRFAAAILPVEHLPPSYHSRWHHCYWSVCVDAVALDGNSSKTLVVPILFFPSSVFSLPYAPSVDSSLARHETKIKLTGYGCCVPAGFIRSTLAWPAPPSLASVLQDDRSTFITGVAIPLTLTLDLAHVNPSFIAPDEVKPGRIAVHQRIMGTTSCIDDVLSLDKIDVVWVDESEDAEVKKWTSTVVLPDKLITSFETPAFLLAVKHSLSVTISLPLFVGGSQTIELPIVLTRQLSSPPSQPELARLSIGFKSALHVRPRHLFWGGDRQLGPAPVRCANMEEKGVDVVEMDEAGDGFPRLPNSKVAAEMRDEKDR